MFSCLHSKFEPTPILSFFSFLFSFYLSFFLTFLFSLSILFLLQLYFLFFLPLQYRFEPQTFLLLFIFTVIASNTLGWNFKGFSIQARDGPDIEYAGHPARVQTGYQISDFDSFSSTSIKPNIRSRYLVQPAILPNKEFDIRLDTASHKNTGYPA